MKKKKKIFCENCGEKIKGKDFFGCCDSDCYIGRINGRSMKNFLSIIKDTQALLRGDV